MTELTVMPSHDRELAPVGPRELSVDELVAQSEKIREVQRRVMREGVHYGVIPGTSRKDKDGNELTKPSLLKPGAETLCLVFRLSPEFEIVRSVETDTEITFVVRCVLTHIPTGVRYATCIGSASSREKKYQRDAKRKCPTCQAEAINHSKDADGGWYCWRKIGGCGATFADGLAAIEGQVVGKTANPEVWDSHNSILKIAQKRSFVGATLSCTAASDSFTQDLEDMSEANVGQPAFETHQQQPAAKPAAPPPAKPPAAPPTGKVTHKQLRRYHALREELDVSEDQGRARVAAFLKREVKSISEDVSSEEMDRITAAMDRETKNKDGAK